MKKRFFYVLALGLFFATGCKKEESFELPNKPAEGSLQDDASGDCLPKVVNGVYAVGRDLNPNSNTITVSVNVTKIGSYTIYTDTVNNYSFRATGMFTSTGIKNVTMLGKGTPFAAGINNFVVHFGNSVCDIQVTVTQPGAGTLAGSPNACSPITVNGAYSPGVALTPANNAIVTVNVTTAGSFSFTTDTVEGVWFTYSGTLSAGVQTARMQANGIFPATTTTGNKTFRVRLGSSTCTFVVPVAPPGVATLGGAGGACTPITINGSYQAGTPLTASNTIVVQVTVVNPGNISITTNTVNGYSFSFSGNLTASGPVTLVGSGTPIAASTTDNFTVTIQGSPASTCSFTNTVTAGGAAVFTVNCASADPEGLYEQGTQLNASNTVDIDVNVTTIGTYNITTTPTNGMTFTASGTFTTTGVTTITLRGSGTPVASGNFNIPVPGTPACTFPLTVDPPLSTYHWRFTVTNAPATTYRGENDTVLLGSNPPIPGTSLVIEGSNAIGSDYFAVVLIDISGTINNGETYSTSATVSNVALFSYELPAPLIETYSADPTTTGVSMTFTVTNHNVATKTITGTFSGTAKNMAGQTITITGGTFTATYL